MYFNWMFKIKILLANKLDYISISAKHKNRTYETESVVLMVIIKLLEHMSIKYTSRWKVSLHGW